MPFEFQPTLRGRLIDLRPLRPGDFDALFAVASDPLIWEQHPDKTRCTPAGFRRFFDESIASGGALLATRAGTDEVVGSSRYFDHREGESAVEIGWSFLARACWGGPHNQDMKRLMVEHAFRSVRRVVFIVDPGNLRSQQALLKLGAVREGTRLEPSGRESMVFILTPERWARSPVATGSTP